MGIATPRLVVFAPLVLIVHLLGRGSTATSVACIVFVAARLAHVLIYAAGVPLLRTLAFAIGFGCQMLLLLAAFGLA